MGCTNYVCKQPQHQLHKRFVLPERSSVQVSDSWAHIFTVSGYLKAYILPHLALIVLSWMKVLESPALPTGFTSSPSNCNHLISLQLLPGARSLSLCTAL